MCAAGSILVQKEWEVEAGLFVAFGRRCGREALCGVER